MLARTYMAVGSGTLQSVGGGASTSGRAVIGRLADEGVPVRPRPLDVLRCAEVFLDADSGRGQLGGLGFAEYRARHDAARPGWDLLGVLLGVDLMTALSTIWLDGTVPSGVCTCQLSVLTDPLTTDSPSPHCADHRLATASAARVGVNMTPAESASTIC